MAQQTMEKLSNVVILVSTELPIVLKGIREKKTQKLEINCSTGCSRYSNALQKNAHRNQGWGAVATVSSYFRCCSF